jgi:hypothetical protein
MPRALAALDLPGAHVMSRPWPDAGCTLPGWPEAPSVSRSVAGAFRRDRP